MRTRLPGPLFAYDLVASTRRGQHAGLRCLVAGLLLVGLYCAYALSVQGYDPLANPFRPGPVLHVREQARLAGTFAAWCLGVQFAALLLLTPAVVADAIAREKERRALEFLFVTDLTDPEIVVGKLGARLAYLVGVLLTGLPILALLELFGGLDPVVLFGGYAVLFATLLGVGAISMYCSVASATALQATVRAYAVTLGYMVVCPCLLSPVFRSFDMALPGCAAYVLANLLVAFVVVQMCVHDLRPRAERLAPLPAPAPVIPVRPVPRRRPPPPRQAAPPAGADDELPFVLPAEEPVAAAPLPADRGWDPVEPPPPRRPAWEPPPLPRAPLPPVDDERPLLWKEVHLHSVARWAGDAAAPLLMTVLVIGAMLAFIVLLLAAVDPHAGENIPELGNGLVRIGTILLGGVLGLGAMVHTVNSVTREREKDTLDGLLTLPLPREAVLEAKWLGGLVSLRLAAVGLAVVWGVGLLTGGLHPLALPRLALAVAAPVEFLASLGLWLSVVCRTSLRANMAAALCLLLVAFGPWIVANYAEMLSPSSAARAVAGDLATEALMPFLTWNRLTVTWGEYAKLPAYRMEFLLAGSLVYAVAAWLLWRAACARFRAYGGRVA